MTVCARTGARRELPTTVTGLLTLRDWLASHGVTQVTMEATGVYWKPVWAILEDEVEVECVLVNARHVKQVPGRKTDVSDAAWIWPTSPRAACGRRSRPCARRLRAVSTTCTRSGSERSSITSTPSTSRSPR